MLVALGLHRLRSKSWIYMSIFLLDVVSSLRKCTLTYSFLDSFIHQILTVHMSRAAFDPVSCWRPLNLGREGTRFKRPKKSLGASRPEGFIRGTYMHGQSSGWTGNHNCLQKVCVLIAPSLTILPQQAPRGHPHFVIYCYRVHLPYTRYWKYTK